jgi:N-acetylglucosamine-6-sulfatase
LTRARSISATAVAVALMMMALIGAANGWAGSGGSADPAGEGRPSGDPRRPNIVFVLTDDFSWNLVRYMPRVQALQRSGVTFSRYFVANSLCCPSRAAIMTGAFPHNNGIFTNAGDDGGFLSFRRRGLEDKTIATALRPAGYRTALMGKYLNSYKAQTGYRPPG